MCIRDRWLYRKLARACAPDKSAEAAQDACAALVEGKAGSTGYALAYALLLDTASISNAVITGEGESWNALKLEDEWYHADAFCGEFAQDVEDFFGLTDEAMAPSHKWKREDAPRCQGCLLYKSVQRIGQLQAVHGHVRHFLGGFGQLPGRERLLPGFPGLAEDLQ